VLNKTSNHFLSKILTAFQFYIFPVVEFFIFSL